MEILLRSEPGMLQLAACEGEKLENGVLEFVTARPELLEWLEAQCAEIKDSKDVLAYASVLRLAAGCFALGWAMRQLLAESASPLSVEATAPLLLVRPT